MARYHAPVVGGCGRGDRLPTTNEGLGFVADLLRTVRRLQSGESSSRGADPELVGRGERHRRVVQDAELDFRLLLVRRKQSRATFRTEVAKFRTTVVRSCRLRNWAGAALLPRLANHALICADALPSLTDGSRPQTRSFPSSSTKAARPSSPGSAITPSSRASAIPAFSSSGSADGS